MRCALPFAALVMLGGLGACGEPRTQGEPSAQADDASAPEVVRMPAQHMHWPTFRAPKPVTRADAEPLVFHEFSEPVGEGYAIAKVAFGPPLYTGKWLGLSWGNGEVFGEHHVIVNVFGSRPRDRFHRDIKENVLLDVDSGAVGPSFARKLSIDYERGRALVKQAGDARVFLLSARNPELVSVYPEGTHPYVYGDNYWVELGEQVWIAARDEGGQVHLFEWEDRSAPPPLPDNPFAFWPEPGNWRHTPDHVEVYRRSGEGCRLAILTPPRGYWCLADETLAAPDIAQSEPLVDGWRFDADSVHGSVFNVLTGESHDLSPLCEKMYLRYANGAKTLAWVFCDGDDDFLGTWSAPGELHVADAATARKYHAAELSYVYKSEESRWYQYGEEREGVLVLRGASGVREVVGPEYECGLDDWYARWGGDVYGQGCGAGNSIALVDTARRVRSRRFSGRDFVLTPSGGVFVRASSGREKVQRMGLQ